MVYSGQAFGLTSDFAYGPSFTDAVEVPGGIGTATPTYKITGSYSERLVVVRFTVAAVGGAGVRTPRLDFEDAAGNVFGSVVAPFTVAAGFTSAFTFGRDINPAGANNGPAITQTLPEIFLAPGESVVVTVGGGLAADTIGTIRGQSEKFSTSPRDFPPGQGPESSNGY